MAYSFRDPKLERELTAVAQTHGDSKLGVLRRLVEAEMRRVRRRLKEE
jgi:hypothetical protein